MPGKIYTIKVIPNSKNTKIIEQKDNFLKLKLTAPAHEGKANKALIAFLSKEFKIAKNKITITAGKKSTTKKIKIIL